MKLAGGCLRLRVQITVTKETDRAILGSCGDYSEGQKQTRGRSLPKVSVLKRPLGFNPKPSCIVRGGEAAGRKRSPNTI